MVFDGRDYQGEGEGEWMVGWHLESNRSAMFLTEREARSMVMLGEGRGMV